MRTVLFLFFISPNLLFGQGFGGGVYAGISTSQVTGDGIAGFHKVGGWGGAFTDYRFTPRSTVQLELSFIQKGSRQTPTVQNNNRLIFFNQNILEIPVMYRWYGIKNMSIELGIQTGILLSTLERETNFQDTRNSNAYRSVEMSGAAGLSYYLWKNKIEVNMRYSNSLFTLKTRQWWMNHVFAFSVRFWFKTTLDRDRIEATKPKNAIKVNIDTGSQD